MFWLACVATAQAPTLSDRVDALEAIVQKLESTVHEQRLTISSLQRALVSNTPSSTDAWPATAPRHRRQLSGTTTMLELKPDAAGSSATLEADGNGALSVNSPGGTSFAGDVSIGSGAALELPDTARNGLGTPLGADQDTVLSVHSDPHSEIPTGDGFRMRYAHDWFTNAVDAVVFEKTDENNANPDGGIVFTNAGSDGVSETSMVIRGTGKIGMGTESPDPETKLHVSGNLKVTSGDIYTSGAMTAQYVYDSGLGANEVGATMKAAIAHAICHANTKADAGGAIEDNHAVIVLPFTDRTKPIDDVCKEKINNSWGGCGVVKDNYWDQECPGNFLSSMGDITNSYGGGGYTSYLSRSTQPNGPQKASCEGTGADVKAWICCATECV